MSAERPSRRGLVAVTAALVAASGIVIVLTVDARRSGEPGSRAERRSAAAPAAAAPSTSPPDPLEPGVDADPPRFDQPDAARAFALAKRRPVDPAVDADLLYRRAVDRVRRMPRYSTRLGRRIGRTGPSPLAADSEATLDTWEFVGPGNVGGRTRVLRIHPTKSRIMWAAGVSGGIWKTTRRGRRWEPVGETMSNIAVNSMALHPDNPDLIYAGTGEGYFRERVRGTSLPLRGRGIYLSEDGGETWSHLESTGTVDFHWVNDLIVSPRNDHPIYAATRTGVWRSDDAGTGWKRILPTDRKGGCLDLELRTDTDTDVLFASCGTLEPAAVYRTDDASVAGIAGGWTVVLEDPAMSRTEVAIAPSDQEIVYALAASAVPGPDGNYRESLHALFRSDSGGDPGSWRIRVSNTDPVKAHTLLLSNPVLAMRVECGFRPPNEFLPMGWYANVLAVDPVNPDRVYAGSVDLFRSDDGGRTWGAMSFWWARSSTPSFAHADHHAITFDPRYDGVTNRRMFVVGDGGVFRTDDATAPTARGETGLCDPFNSRVAWENFNNHYGVTQFYHGLPYPDGRSYFGGTQDNGTVRGRDRDGPDAWRRLFGGDGGHVAIDPDDTDVIYVSTQYAQFRKSTNGGLDFTLATRGLDPARQDLLGTDTNYLFITPMAMDPNEPRRLWTGGRRLFRTDDGMDSWVPASRRLRRRSKMSAIDVSPADSRFVAAGDTRGYVYFHRRATRADAETRWRSIRPRRGWVTSVSFDPSVPRILYATYASFGGDHVFRSRRRGRQWRSIDGAGETGVPDIPVHDLAVDPTDRSRLYIGTDLGVLVSLDGGETWAVENTGFGNIVTESLSIVDTGRTLYLFAFTHGRGVWRVEIP